MKTFNLLMDVDDHILARGVNGSPTSTYESNARENFSSI